MHTTQNFLIYKYIENNIQQKLPDQMNEAISLSNKRKGLLLEGFFIFLMFAKHVSLDRYE